MRLKKKIFKLKMFLTAAVGFIIIIFSGNLLAQNSELQNAKLTGNLKYDSKIVGNYYQETLQPEVKFQLPHKKSPLIAGALSFVLPGAGQFYTENYWKTALFVVIEGAAITTAVVYDKKGDNQTADFQKFANQNWSVVRYAQWLMDHKAQLNLPDDCNITINPDASLPPQQRVNWDELNHCEQVFSHRLHPYGDQQYYELIGKYPQFSPGWVTFQGDDYHNIPQIFHDYSHMRGKANDYYNVAAKAVIAIYVNHVLSILDAVLDAVSYNKNLVMNVRVKKENVAFNEELIPTFNIKYNF